MQRQTLITFNEIPVDLLLVLYCRHRYSPAPSELRELFELDFDACASAIRAAQGDLHSIYRYNLADKNYSRAHALHQAHRFLKRMAAEHARREEADRLLAVAMSQHTRLGGASSLRTLPGEQLEQISRYYSQSLAL